MTILCISDQNSAIELSRIGSISILPTSGSSFCYLNRSTLSRVCLCFTICVAWSIFEAVKAVWLA